MPKPPKKRRRTAANPYLDLEATVDHDIEPEECENEEDRAFINDDIEGEGNEGEEGDEDDAVQARRRQEWIDFLREDGQLEDGGMPEEQEHASILREILGLDQGEGNGAENPLVADDDETDDDEDEVVSVPRPLWEELGHVNAAVAGALVTHQDDDDERGVSADDTLFEVSCQPGMEETIAFRIFSWALQVDSAGPTSSHILEPSSGSSLPPHNRSIRPSRVPLARSAIANPFLRGRVYIESDRIGYVQRLARRVRGLNPASVRPVPRELLLRPLIMMQHSFPDQTFVRLLDPPCPSMTCLIVKDHLLMVPAGLHSKSSRPTSKFNADTDAMPAPPCDSHTDDFLLDTVYLTATIRIDSHGFRYYPLKLLGSTALEAYEPSVPEVEMLFKFGRLDNRHYQYYMTRIMAYSFSTGDRVFIQAGAFQSLIGTVLNPTYDGSCRIYVASQGSVIQVARQQLRRYFCIGDRVSATSADVIEKLGSRFGWVVSVSDGYKTAWSSTSDSDAIAGQTRTQVGYKVDLCVFSPHSGKEIIAAHYEFQFEDDSTVSLQTVPTSSPVSEMQIGKIYTLTIPMGFVQCRSFTGVVADIEGVHVRPHGTEAPTELAATMVFSIWDKTNDAPFGYPRNWIIDVPDFSDYNIPLGETVTLRDRDGRCGTARITRLGRREVTLANFTGALKFSDLAAIRRVGPYDCHIGKTVCVAKGPFKGGIGLVKTVNTVGVCTVELNIQPIRNITVNISRLTAVDESELYTSLVPILDPPPRSITPPPAASSSDTPPAFQVSSSDIITEPPRPPDLDCRWLAQPFAQQMAIKLEPINRQMQRPYHFSSAFYDNSGEVPRLMFKVFDRKKERDFPADELRWLPPNDTNQTVVRITGEDQGALFWTVRVDQDNCQVRRVPSNRRVPLMIFPRFELAQVNAKRT